jgi:hypothetical protein
LAYWETEKTKTQKGNVVPEPIKYPHSITQEGKPALFKIRQIQLVQLCVSGRKVLFRLLPKLVYSKVTVAGHFWENYFSISGSHFGVIILS